MSSCCFKRRHYHETLQNALALGYQCIGVTDFFEGNFAPDGKILVLRHDMDGPLAPELGLSEVEKALGVRSTFYVRLHAKFYNPFSLEGIRTLRQLVANGSEIGLHYEPSFSHATGISQHEGLRRDKIILETGLGLSIRSMAPHEPERNGCLTLDTKSVAEAGFSNQAYDERIFKGCRYLSDSGSRWREGCFCQWLGREPRLYVLTHGFWWCEESSLENY